MHGLCNNAKTKTGHKGNVNLQHSFMNECITMNVLWYWLEMLVVWEKFVSLSLCKSLWTSISSNFTQHVDLKKYENIIRACCKLPFGWDILKVHVKQRHICWIFIIPESCSKLTKFCKTEILKHSTDKIC